jgi:hypothetical protein
MAKPMPATLWTRRWSISTISPRLSVGTRHYSTLARNIGPLMAPSSTNGHAALPQAAHEDDRFPLSLRRVVDEPFAARSTAAQPHHYRFVHVSLMKH